MARNWVIVGEAGSLGGLVKAARGEDGVVEAAVVGSRELAEAVARAGAEFVHWYPLEEGVPPEAVAPVVAGDIAAAAPRVILGLQDAPTRVLLAAAAQQQGGVLLDSLLAVRAERDCLVATRAALGGRVVETVEVAGSLAGIFAGADVIPEEVAAGEIVEARTQAPGGLATVGVDSAGNEASLSRAERIVAVGLGVRSSENLQLVEQLAKALDAQVACSLPVSEELHWFDESRVVGVSSNTVSPDLYLAVGISGQPQHLEGVRGAKVIAAINTDPDAPIFRVSRYGIQGDLAEVIPALTAAVKQG